MQEVEREEEAERRLEVENYRKTEISVSELKEEEVKHGGRHAAAFLSSTSVLQMMK